MRYLALFAHEGCLAVFLVYVYSNVDCHLWFFTSVPFSVGLNAAITYSRAWRIQGAAPEVCPFTHSTDRRSARTRAYQPRRTYYAHMPRDFSSIHTHKFLTYHGSNSGARTSSSTHTLFHGDSNTALRTLFVDWDANSCGCIHDVNAGWSCLGVVLIMLLLSLRRISRLQLFLNVVA